VSVRTSLAEIFRVLGHHVRCASDGLAALIEMHQETLEILLSDLNMLGMSGFELLAVVRSRFPSTRVVAMSGAFSGNQVPCGVAADAYYEKGNGVAVLLKAIDSLSLANRKHIEVSEHVPTQLNGQATNEPEFVRFAGPD